MMQNKTISSGRSAGLFLAKLFCLTSTLYWLLFFIYHPDSVPITFITTTTTTPTTVSKSGGIVYPPGTGGLSPAPHAV